MAMIFGENQLKKIAKKRVAQDKKPGKISKTL